MNHFCSVAAGTPVMLLTVGLLFSPMRAWGQADKSVDSVRIEKGDLAVVFRDNSKSPGTLSGIDSLLHIKDAPKFDAFDPDGTGASAGLNFEHIISGHKNPNNKFTPRHGPFRLVIEPGGDAVNAVKLVRRAKDSPWNVDSEFSYRIVEPHYIDFEFRCTPRDAAAFGQRGYALFFFANYMHDVADAALNFRGQEAAGATEKWITANAPSGHRDWMQGGNYRSLPAKELEYDDDVEFRLNTWSYDWPRFSAPFYYGLADHGMTLMLMFDRSHSRRDQIRFSLYKFKLPERPRPAWDFQYVINKVSSDEEYGFSGRLVWKKFVSPQDCLQEYTAWTKKVQAERVQRLRQLGATVFTRGDVIVEVNANRTRISDNDLEAMSGFVEVTDLSLEETGITDVGISHVSNLQKLEWLNLYRCAIGDSGLQELKHLKSLRHLPIGESKVTDNGLHHIAEMQQLVYLGLRGNDISDAGVKSLAGLTNLTGLHLGKTNVTDQGLVHLQGMHKLKRLWLDETTITDEAVEHLVKLSALSELYLRDTGVTRDGLKRIQRSLPKCHIETSVP